MHVATLGVGDWMCDTLSGDSRGAEISEATIGGPTLKRIEAVLASTLKHQLKAQILAGFPSFTLRNEQLICLMLYGSQIVLSINLVLIAQSPLQQLNPFRVRR